MKGTMDFKGARYSYVNRMLTLQDEEEEKRKQEEQKQEEERRKYYEKRDKHLLEQQAENTRLLCQALSNPCQKQFMDLEDVLKIIKEDFPDNLNNISESLESLIDTIYEAMNNINEKIKQSHSNRDFATVEKYINLSKTINFYETKINEIINFTRIENKSI